jgi:hypothetical protein
MRSKVIFLLLIIDCILINSCKFDQSSTSFKVKELSIPLSEYNVPIEIKEVAYSNDRIEFQESYYRYNMTKTLFTHNWIDSNKVLIRYHEIIGFATPKRPKDLRIVPLDNEIIIYLSQGKDCITKCCYIKWKNDDYIDEKGIKWRYSDLGINKSTIKLETNINPTIIKKMYPELKCAIEYKRYRKISVDYYYEMQNLDFFHHIAFEE